MNISLRNLLFIVAFFACGSIVNAQLPNEKFGKPSSMEWDYVGWGSAVDADAIILCKTMNVTYQLSNQVADSNQAVSELSHVSIDDFGRNQIDDGGILVKYKFKLRTKILKPEGAKHANIDITYYDLNDKSLIDNDEIGDLKVRVFKKNEKGKVEKKYIPTGSFVKERIDDNYVVIHVVVPDVKPGEIIEYQYSITSSRPTYLYDWVFQESIPTVRSKCDMNVPAFLQFKMNVPVNKLIKGNVEVGHITYDSNRADMKKGMRCSTNHYTIVGDYILPKGYPLKDNAGEGNGEVQEKIAIFTSQITNADVTAPAIMPKGSTHLRVK